MSTAPLKDNLTEYFRSLRLNRDVDGDDSEASTQQENSISDNHLTEISTRVGPVSTTAHFHLTAPSQSTSAWAGGAAAGAVPPGLVGDSDSPLTSSPCTSSPGKAPTFLLLPPPALEHRSRNTLVLDLDETLVHSSSNRATHNPRNPNDLILRVSLDGRICEIFVHLRPYMREFLALVGELFEVVIFTASLSKYASPLIDQIDPEKRHCHHRLFREHCTLQEGSYVKDLSLLGRSLNKVIIIDNSPTAFLYQPRNAIPCTTWIDDPHDTELQQFLPLLKLLSAADDVYPILDAFHELLAQHGN